jgi:hypothetical protein
MTLYEEVIPAVAAFPDIPSHHPDVQQPYYAECYQRAHCRPHRVAGPYGFL